MKPHETAHSIAFALNDSQNSAISTSKNNIESSYKETYCSSFSSLESFGSSTSQKIVRFSTALVSEPTATMDSEHEGNELVTLVAQALQHPCLSESALLLIKTLRETANINRAPKTFVNNVAYISSDSTPLMDHDEKVKVLRSLYSKRRNRISTDKKGEAQQQIGEETYERKRTQNEHVSEALESELQKMIQQSSSLAKAKIVTPTTPRPEEVTATTNTDTAPAVPAVVDIPNKLLLPYNFDAINSHKRKHSSLESNNDASGHVNKKLKISSRVVTTKRQFASRCA